MECDVDQWVEMGRAEIPKMHGMVKAFDITAMTPWFAPTWYKDDVRVITTKTKALYDNVSRQMERRRELAIEAAIAKQQGEEETVQMITRELEDLTIWTGITPKLGSMQLQLEGATKDQGMVTYFEFRLLQAGPMKSMKPEAQAVEIRKLIGANILRADYVLKNVEIIPNMGLAESRPGALQIDPLGAPFLVLAHNKSALRTVAGAIKPWVDKPISLQLNGRCGDVRFIMRVCNPTYAGEVSLKKLRFFDARGAFFVFPLQFDNQFDFGTITFCFDRNPDTIQFYANTNTLCDSCIFVFLLQFDNLFDSRVTINFCATNSEHSCGHIWSDGGTHRRGTAGARAYSFRGWPSGDENEKDVRQLFARLAEHEAAFNPLLAGLWLEKWKHGWTIHGYIFQEMISRLCEIIARRICSHGDSRVRVVT